MTTTRESWDAYFVRIAYDVATRATCDRRHVGCVLVRDKCILGTGFNGSLRGQDHCDDAGHVMVDGHCVRVIHAEANALMQAARHGVRVDGATAYVTAFPCHGCLKLLAQAGVVAVVYAEPYRPDDDAEVAAMAAAVGIEIRRHVSAPTWSLVVEPVEGGGAWRTMFKVGVQSFQIAYVQVEDDDAPNDTAARNCHFIADMFTKALANAGLRR